MKRIIVAAIVTWVAGVPAVEAYDHSLNPDRYVSIGMDISGGKLPGMLKTVNVGDPSSDGGFVKGLLDIRLPISNAITLHAFGSSTGINNNLNFSEGSEIGAGIRVYLQ